MIFQVEPAVPDVCIEDSFTVISQIKLEATDYIYFRVKRKRR